MLERGTGRIVNVSSGAGVVGTTNSFTYAATKGDINAITRQAAIEYAKQGIRVNAVWPPV